MNAKVVVVWKSWNEFSSDVKVEAKIVEGVVQMSASRDKSQKVAFVYSNLYQIYQNEKQTKQLTENAGLRTRFQSPILKTESLKNSPLKVRSYEPAELIRKRIEARRKPVIVPAHKPIQASVIKKDPQSTPIEGLKKNIDALNDLRSRLNFMLKEIEELTQED